MVVSNVFASNYALDKLGLVRHMYNCAPVEVVQSNTVFDIASLMLFGTTATPIRLKILLDRLFSVLKHDEVLQVLNGFGWTYEDYARGYILQDKDGNVLDKWSMPTREEEAIILQQFLRFGETKSITQQILMQESNERADYALNSPKTESDIKKFIERANYVAATAFNQPRLNQEKTIPRLPSNASSSQNLSPTSSSGSFGSPTNCTSPSLSASPLNKLQSMLPHNYRQSRMSPSESPHTSSIPSKHPSIPSAITTMPPSGLSLINSNPINMTKTVSMHNDSSFDGNSVEWGSDDDSLGESSCGALNLSTAGQFAINQSIFASKKIRHLRKSVNPMRRRWNSSTIGSISINPSSGKKRVQCHVCMKTFCDKGALKIHYSAVHLREMHKCTVEGCNMMFSSRRSRNRHSANPNPKLHIPNSRRKISPHDGRVANPLPLIPPSMSFNPSMVSPLFPDSSKPTHIKDIDSPLLAGAKPSANDTCMSDLPPLYEIEKPNNLAANGCIDDGEDFGHDKALPLTYKRQSCDSEGDSHVSNNDEKSASYQNESSLLNNNARGVRKRKSLNPTRCAINDSHRLPYTSTDDSSSEEDGGVAFRQDELDDSSDNNGLSDSDSESEFTNPPMKKSKDHEEVSSLEYHKEPVVEVKEEVQAVESKKEDDEVIVMQEDDIKKESKERIEDDHDVKASSVNNCDETSVNALRQLENLSQSTFCDFLNSASNRLMGNPHLVPGSMGFFPTNPMFGMDAAKSNPSSSNGPTLPTSSDQEPLGCRDNSLLHSSIPSFTENSLLGGMDIPVDKDNPRRCIACGKIFQNHFGVKTHYQNVHLKLMHKCTVEGCNAAFPSKRSRDRHSANLNLHRKLLSTSSDPGSKLSTTFIDKSGGGLTPPSPFGSLPPLPPVSHPQGMREELFSRLYDPHSLSAALSFAEFYHGGKLPDALLNNGDRLGFFNHPFLPGFPPFLPSAAGLGHDFGAHHNNLRLDKDRDTPTSLNSSPSPPTSHQVLPSSKSPSLNNNNNNINKDDFKDNNSPKSTCDSGDEATISTAKGDQDNNSINKTVSATV